MSDNLIIANLVISTMSIFLIPIINGIVSCMSRVKHSKCCNSDLEFDSIKKGESLKDIKIDK